MSHDDLLFVHPLLGTDDAWSGYLVEAAPHSSPDAMLRELARHPALGGFDQRQPWFLPAHAGSAECPLQTAVHVFSEISETSLALEEALRQKKARVAQVLQQSSKLPQPGAWDHVLLSAIHARTLPPYSLLGISSRTGIVAAGVQSHADHKWVQANACNLCTTEFLLIRHEGDKKADVTRVKLLELLALLAEDADTEAIEAIFRQEPKLSYSLLRLVNSAAMGPRSPITSFAQAINILGRRQLQRWLQLLVYADPNNGNHPNPLLQKAAARGRLMELLTEGMPPLPDVDHNGDAAFMTGAFSLLDVLLNMPMRDILKQLPLPPTVHDALDEESGPFGPYLKLLQAAENREFDKACTAFEEAGLSGQRYLDAQLQAFSWAARIHTPA